MPGNNAWDGKWSGDGKLFAIVRTLRNQTAEKVLTTPVYGYAFGDGWFASVNVAAVDGTEAARIKKQSQGFCGYDWMVDSIVQHGRIIAS